VRMASRGRLGGSFYYDMGFLTLALLVVGIAR